MSSQHPTPDAHEDPSFLTLCREHGIEGTAQVALCGAFWNRAVATKEGAAEPVGVALDWTKIEAFVDGYVDEYEMRGETEDGRDACYTPNDNDRALLRDCIAGLLSEPEFIAAFATPPAVMPAALSDAVTDGTSFLIQICGEDIDHPLTAIVPNWEGVRRFCVEHYTGSEDAENLCGNILDTLKNEFDEHEAEETGKPYTEQWEIGGLSIERVCDCTPRAALSQTMQPQAKPAAGEQAGAVTLRKGHVVVPMRLTRAMQRILDEEGWEWADLLMAAEATTEEEDEAIRRFESLDMLEKAEREAAEQQDLAAPGAAIAAREQETLTNDNSAADWLTTRAHLHEWLADGAQMHPHTINLVVRFARALAEKLAAAEKKYGYSDGWLSPDWMDECRAKLMEHIAKGDPRDVAAYCAFLWHHGESTASREEAPATPQGEAVLWQWRRKGDPWTIEKTFIHPVVATTADSEVRVLYTQPTTAQQAETAAASEVDLIEKAAVRVGMKSLMNHGAASCVYTEGCNGVSQAHLIAFAREVALHCVAALAQPAALQYAGPWCCEKGQAAGKPVCDECAEISRGYSTAMAPCKAGRTDRGALVCDGTDCYSCDKNFPAEPDDTPLETGEGDAL